MNLNERENALINFCQAQRWTLSESVEAMRSLVTARDEILSRAEEVKKLMRMI
jgi:hypothetical protein